MGHAAKGEYTVEIRVLTEGIFRTSPLRRARFFLLGSPRHSHSVRSSTRPASFDARDRHSFLAMITNTTKPVVFTGLWAALQASKDAVHTGASGTWPAYLTGFRREGGEVPCSVGFAT